MQCIAVDWSGAVTGAARRIWMACARDGALTALEAPGSREAVCRALLARRDDPTPTLVGLDFAFGLPKWYAQQRGWQDVTDVWRAARDEGEQWLRECAAPFWGRPGVRRPHPIDRGLRATEFADAGVRPKSVFQVGGAGSVGTGSIRGMPMLLTLRAAGWAVWPFDEPSSHTLVEIWPRHFTGPVIKNSAVHRAHWLQTSMVALRPDWFDLMHRSEDAFDAGVSAVRMSCMVMQDVLRTPADPVTRIEGAICRPEPMQAV